VGIVVSLIGAAAPSVDAGRTQTVQALAPGSYEVAQAGRTRLLASVGCLLLGAALLSLFGRPLGEVPVFGYLATLGLLAGLSCLVPILIQLISRFGERGEPRAGLGLSRILQRMALSHLGRTPGRHGVTVSALMIGVAIMVGVVIMIQSFRHTVEVWIDETVLADVIIAPTTWLTGAQAGQVATTLPPEWESAIRQVEGVAAVDTYRDIRIDLKGRSVALVSRDLRLHAERSRYLIRGGDSKTILNETVTSDGVLVSEVLANKVGVKEDDTVALNSPSGLHSFRIVGVFYDYATDGGKVVMDRGLYRRLWQDEGVTVFPVYLAPSAALEEVRQRLTFRLNRENDEGDQPVLVSNRELREEILHIFDRTFALTYVLEGIAVVIAVLGIVNTLVISVIERQRELATFRAIGASDAQVTGLILWEAVYLGGIGALAGVGGGLLLSLLLIHVINKQSFGWTIQTMIPLSVLAEAVLLALAAALVAGYWPARWAVKQPVVEGLRYE
jgi:putative ABC transport system permease protein